MVENNISVGYIKLNKLEIQFNCRFNDSPFPFTIHYSISVNISFYYTCIFSKAAVLWEGTKTFLWEGTKTFKNQPTPKNLTRQQLFEKEVHAQAKNNSTLIVITHLLIIQGIVFMCASKILWVEDDTTLPVHSWNVLH